MNTAVWAFEAQHLDRFYLPEIGTEKGENDAVSSLRTLGGCIFGSCFRGPRRDLKSR
jgi:hypothetical protein